MANDNDLANDNANSKQNQQEEEIYEVKEIVGHKKIENTDYYRIRWAGYCPEDDTWEPDNNLLGETTRSMIKEFMERKERQKRQMVAKRKETAQKRKSRVIKQEYSEGESENESWFGFKHGEGSRENQRLFVPARVLTESEKVLAESMPGERIFRHQVKALMTPTMMKNTSPAQAKLQLSLSGKRGRPSRAKNEPNEIGWSTPRLQNVLPESSAESRQQQNTESNDCEEKSAITECVDGIMSAVVQKAPSEKSKDDEPQKSKQMTEKPNKDVRDTSALPKIRSCAFFDAIESQSKRQRMVSWDDISLPILDATTDIGAYIEELDKSAQAKRMKLKLTQNEFEAAVMGGDVKKVKAAFDGGSEVSLNRTFFGETLLHKLCEMKCNVNHDICELIDILVKRGARMELRETQNGNIPLHIAISNRQICHVHKLISLRSPLNMVNFSNQSPIVLTLNFNDDAFIDALLNAGASYQPVFVAIRDNKPPLSRHILINNVNPHQKKLQEAFDAARISVCRNMAVIRNLSPIFINPLYESPDIEHTFRCEINLPGPDHCFVVFTSICELYAEKAIAKMWGPSPVMRVSVNGVASLPIIPNASGYVFLCHARTPGINSLHIKLDPSDSTSTLKLLTQVAFVRFEVRSDRLQRPE